MACHVVPGPITPETESVQEAVCIHTRKVMDSCRDKDCLEDLQFYPTVASADTLSSAISLKGSCAELLHVFVSVEPVCFNRGYYAVDMRYYYRVTLQAYQSTSVRGTEVEGLCVFDKRCILFGGEGGSKRFSSRDIYTEGELPAAEGLPLAVVEAVDPMVLGIKTADCCPCCTSLCDVPACVAAAFSSPLQRTSCAPYVMVTLGQFSMVRLERETELLIPVYDYCIPTKECCTGISPGDPCEMFRGIGFPVGEFFPTASPSCRGERQDGGNGCGCGD